MPPAGQIPEHCALCRTLSPSQRETLRCSRYSRVRTYAAGERIFWEGDVPDSMLLLLQGAVLIAKDTPSGKQMVFAHITEPGDLIGEIYAFMRQPTYDKNAVAAENTAILAINQAIFHDPDPSVQAITAVLQQNLLTIFAQTAYMMSRKLMILSSTTLREKLARFILSQPLTGSTLPLSLTREELAAYLNVARPSLSRELGRMAAEGIISCQKNSITVLQQEKLAAYI